MLLILLSTVVLATQALKIINYEDENLELDSNALDDNFGDPRLPNWSFIYPGEPKLTIQKCIYLCNQNTRQYAIVAIENAKEKQIFGDNRRGYKNKFESNS